MDEGRPVVEGAYTAFAPAVLQTGAARGGRGGERKGRVGKDGYEEEDGYLHDHLILPPARGVGSPGA